MAKKQAPAKLTGGSGLNYEDYVAGRFLVDMLRGIYSFGQTFGRIKKINWQARDTERLLDDLVVTLESADGEHAAEISIKSDKQVTEAGFPENFVEAAWEEWLGVESNVFNKEKDLLVLVTGQIANDVHSAWQKTLRESRQTSAKRMVVRLTPPTDPNAGSLSSQLQRDQFNSMHCPDRLKNKGKSDAQCTVEVLRRIRLLTFDFESEPSRDEAGALSDCQAGLESGDPQEASRLWIAILRIAADKRASGGSIDHPELIASLRDDFSLTDYPDYRADLDTVKQVSADLLNDIRVDIGGTLSLERADVVGDVAKALAEKRLCFIAGESGCGKSAIAKFVAQQRYGRLIAIPMRAVETGRRDQFQRALNINHSLIELIRSSRESCLVLFDTLEKCSADAARLVARLATEIRADPMCGHAHILFVSQFELAERIISHFVDGGLDREVLRVHPILCPPEEEVASLLSDVPAISYMTLRRELRPVLRNLKILDWVIRASQTGTSVSDANVTGISSLITYLWDRWVEAGDMTFARSGLLKHIAELEADTLEAGVPLSDLNHSELASVGPMEASDLLRIRSERVRFAHDLLGDWARLKLFIERDPTNTPDGIARAALPRWHRAVRLFGKWLLDSANGIQRWREAVDRVGEQTSDSKVVRDLILEAVVLDDDYAGTLNEAWPTLVEGNGQLLRRLLDRFLFVATIPDTRFLSSDLEPRVAAHIAVAYRLPFWPYWPGLLRGLHLHIADVVRVAPVEAAKIARLWLEKTPHEITAGVRLPWRREAAELALAIAREMQALHSEGRYFEDDQGRIAYEAALFGATELPNEVALFALEMANRRPPSPQIAARIEAEKQAREARVARQREENPDRVREMEQLGVPILPRGEMRIQWPDGPSARVSESFREAVLESAAWLSLMKARTNDAVEVLFAVCIEEPQESSPYGSDGLIDYYGLGDWHKAYPPMYFRGPFLQFFRQAPIEAIDFAIRLVNFATARWAESQKNNSWRYDREAPSDAALSVPIPLEAGERRWFGNDRVYRWHADGACDTAIIPSVLMALEKYLYEQLDVGVEIGGSVQGIVDRSLSLAFAGMLIDVGKHSPALFLNELRPLLGDWVFYFWDRDIVHELVNFHGGLIGWIREPSQLQQLAREWHTQQHRKQLLIDIAQFLLTQSADLATFLLECIERWRNSFDGEEVPDFFATLVAVLDRDNYHNTTTDEGQPALRFEMPRELAEKNLEGARAAQRDVHAITFPMNCRQWLDGSKFLDISHLDELWQILQGIADQEIADPQSASRKEDAVMGGVAVILCSYRDWLRDAPDKEAWCLEQIQQVVANPPGRSAFDSPDSASEWHWDYFLAEIGVSLLSEDRKNTDARRICGSSITAFHHGVTRLTLKRATERSELLGDDLALLQQMAIRWAMVARILGRSEQLLAYGQEYLGTPMEQFYEGPQIDRIQAIAELWQQERTALVDGFVAGQIEPLRLAEARAQSLPVLEELETMRPNFLGPRPAEPVSFRGRRQRFHREEFGLDISIVHAAYRWLDDSDTLSQLSSSMLLDCVKQLQAFALSTIPTPTDYIKDELDELPGDFDLWLFGVVSRTISQSTPADARALWNPFLELGPYAHHFVEMFFWNWFEQGFVNTTPAIFLERWTEMVRHALESDRWKSDSPAFYRIDMMVYELLGCHFGEAMADDERFAPLLERERDLWAAVADRWFSIPRVVNGFARHVTKPAYNRLLGDGVVWIHRSVVASTEDDFRHERDFESNVIHALRSCWERHPDRVASDPNLRNAFHGLLTELASRGSHAAISLRDSVVDSLSSGG